MKRVFIARHPAEAHFVKGLLQSEGIEAIVLGEDLSGVRGGVPVTLDTSPSVWVLEDSQIESISILIKRYDCSSALEVGFISPWQSP